MNPQPLGILIMLGLFGYLAIMWSISLIRYAKRVMRHAKQFLRDHHVHSWRAFGTHRRVTPTQTTLTEANRCYNCGKPNGPGYDRTYAKEFVIAGFPVKTYDAGHNFYCHICDDADSIKYQLRAGKYENLAETDEIELEPAAAHPSITVSE